MSSAFLSRMRANHWRVGISSRGRSPFSKNLTAWVISSLGRSMTPSVNSAISTILFWASRPNSPASLRVDLVGRVGIEAFPARLAERDGHETAVAADHLAQRQIELAPPLHVGLVAEGADHDDAGSLLGIGLRIGHDRHRHMEQRGDGALAETGLVALILGMRQHGHTGGQQFGTGRGDDDMLAVALDRRSADSETRSSFPCRRPRPGRWRSGNRRPT